MYKRPIAIIKDQRKQKRIHVCENWKQWDKTARSTISLPRHLVENTTLHDDVAQPRRLKSTLVYHSRYDGIRKATVL